MLKAVIEFIFHIDTYLVALIQNYGNFVYFLLFFIIFLETGFVLTPFLPGDSLLFIAGTLAATSALNVYLLFLLLSTAAILGDTANYWLGHYFGEKVFSRFIKPAHLEKTKLFFHRYGKKTIVLARFVPIVRTVAPFVAGIGKMNYFTFLSYNVIGGIVWVAIFVFSGFYFGNIPQIKDNLTIVVFLIIVISLIPTIREYINHKRKKFDNKIYCIVVHGCPSNVEKIMSSETRTYDKHWISWIKKELVARGINTEVPLMPTPWKPDYEKFKKEFEKYGITENTILIGHSCGCAFLVRWLGETKKKIFKLILVAPWKIADEGDEFKKAFYDYPIDETIKNRVQEIIMFTADNEEDDGKKSLKIFHQALGGEVIELEGRGHYTMNDMGTIEFPELLEAVLR